MQIQALINEIQQLPLDKKFFVMEQTLKSIKNEELKQADEINTEHKKFTSAAVNEKSLGQDWLSKEDNRWDNLL